MQPVYDWKLGEMYTRECTGCGLRYLLYILLGTQCGYCSSRIFLQNKHKCSSSMG